MADGKFFGMAIKNASWWNRPIPGTMGVDNAVAKMAGGANNLLKKGFKGMGKLALAGLAVAGTAYAIKSGYDSLRGNNEYQEPEKPQLDPMADLPPMAPPMYDMGGPQQETMMGLAPVTDGRFAQQVMARRGGMAQGINTASPDIESVDGRPVQNMGSLGM